MALTQEQVDQIAFNEALDVARKAHEQTMENLRLQNNLAIAKAQSDAQAAIIAKQAKIEAVRLAKEILIENRRNQPVDAREVTATDVTNFANSLITYVNN